MNDTGLMRYQIRLLAALRALPGREATEWRDIRCDFMSQAVAEDFVRPGMDEVVQADGRWCVVPLLRAPQESAS